jgi:hypothetical protein
MRWDMTSQAGRGSGQPAGVRRREAVVPSDNGGAEATVRQAAPSVEGRVGSRHRR